VATGNFVSLMGAEYAESESGKIIAWAPVSLLPPGLLESRRKPASDCDTKPKGKGKVKAEANEEAEDSGDDGERESEGLVRLEEFDDSGTGKFGEYGGRITMGRDGKKRKFDEVIDLTTRGDRKTRRFDEVIDLTGGDD